MTPTLYLLTGMFLGGVASFLIGFGLLLVSQRNSKNNYNGAGW